MPPSRGGQRPSLPLLACPRRPTPPAPASCQCSFLSPPKFNFPSPLPTYHLIHPHTWVQSPVPTVFQGKFYSGRHLCPSPHPRPPPAPAPPPLPRRARSDPLMFAYAALCLVTCTYMALCPPPPPTCPSRPRCLYSCRLGVAERNRILLDTIWSLFQ